MQNILTSIQPRTWVSFFLIGGGIAGSLFGYHLLKTAWRQEAHLGNSVGEVARSALRRLTPGTFLMALGIGLTGVGGELGSKSPEFIGLETSSLLQLAAALQPPPANATQDFGQKNDPLRNAATVATNNVPLPEPKAPDQTAGDPLGPEPGDEAGLVVWKECNAGNSGGCNSLGVRYLQGEAALPKDAPRAAALFRKACEGGSAPGCDNLGVRYLLGDGLPTDVPRAVTLFARACEAGNPEGCNNVGAHYRSGDGGLPRDMARAVTLFRKACEGGVAEGCFNLGNAYFNGEGGLPRDMPSAAAFFRKACESGDSEACDKAKKATNQSPRNDVPDNRTEGQRIPEEIVKGDLLGPLPDDPAAAAMWRACKGGSAAGCVRLADAVYTGAGLPKDETRATALLVKARGLFERDCADGESRACVIVGTYYRVGMGVGKDPARAAAFFQKACDAGFAGGCESLRDLRTAPEK